MRLINVAETVLFSQMAKMFTAECSCDCERCKLDIAAIALNNLPPSYVVSTEGEIVKSVSNQLKVDVQRELDLAKKKVCGKPHHERC